MKILQCVCVLIIPILTFLLLVFSFLHYSFLSFWFSFSPLLFAGTRPQASGSAIRQSITSTNVSGTLSRPLWPLSARTYPAETTSHWR